MAYREIKYKGEGLRNLNKRLEEIFRRGEEVIHFELIAIEVGEKKEFTDKTKDALRDINERGTEE